MNRLTGRHVLGITLGAFAVILGANVTLAVSALRTFPGLEVANGYIASQTFDADRAAQERLGWTARAGWAAGRLTLALTGPDGRAVQAVPQVLVGRPTEAADDRRPVMVFDGRVWAAEADLGPGRWMLVVEAVAADGTRFRQRLDLWVGG